MNAIDSAKMLNEMRSMISQTRADNMRAFSAEVPSAGGVQPFGKLMTNALQQVNSSQLQAADLQQRVEMGDRSVSLVQAMIASQKANISLQATVQVRNRLVSAYQDIFNMPI